MTDIIWVVVQVMNTIFAAFFGLLLFSWRYAKRKTIITTAIFISLLTIMNAIAIKNMYPIIDVFPQFDFLYRIGNLIILSSFALFIVDLKETGPARFVFTILTLRVVGFMIDTIAVSLRASFGIFPLELLCEFLLFPVMLFIIIKARKMYLEVTRYLGNKLWPLCTVPTLLIIALFYKTSIPLPLEYAPENIPTALILIGIAFTFYATLIFLFSIIRKQSKKVHNAMAMQLHTNALEQQNQISEYNAKMAALFRHDLRHITQMMLSCLDNGNTAEARELLLNIESNVGSSWKDPVLITFTGHKLIDFTMSHYLHYAKESNVRFEADLAPIHDISADRAELAIVLANALENAVNACKKLPEDNEKAVTVSGRRQGKQYFIEIANTFNGKVIINPDSGLPISTEEGHGMGSHSIAYFIQKNRADLEYHQEGNWFRLQLLLC